LPETSHKRLFSSTAVIKAFLFLQEKNIEMPRKEKTAGISLFIFSVFFYEYETGTVLLIIFMFFKGLGLKRRLNSLSLLLF